MDPAILAAIKPKLAALKVLVRNVGLLGPALDANSTREEYRAIYKDILETVGDESLKTYAPPIGGGTYVGSPSLPTDAQAEIVYSGTQLIAYLEALIAEESAEQAVRRLVPRNIFVSHGKRSTALKHLIEFLRTLGLNPIVVEDQPSMGMSVDNKIEVYLAVSEAAVILATGDDKVAGEVTLRPRQNVIHEIGLCQKALGNKIIYLLEQGTEFPSNIRPKVYERFSKGNMTQAFKAVVRELRAWNIL